MIKRCGALVLGLLVLSASAALAQVSFPINNGWYTTYNVGYNNGAGMAVPNNVAIYQNQLMQTQMAYNGAYTGAYNGYGAYNSVNSAYTMGYTTPYTMGGYTSYTPVATSYYTAPAVITGYAMGGHAWHHPHVEHHWGRR